MPGSLGYSVPEFLDLGGRRQPVVNNFPLSHVIFKVNFPLSNDPLALVSAKRQQQRHNTGLSLKSTQLSSFIGLISHILLRVFPSSWLFNAQIFHSDTQAKLYFWDTVGIAWNYNNMSIAMVQTLSAHLWSDPTPRRMGCKWGPAELPDLADAPLEILYNNIHCIFVIFFLHFVRTIWMVRFAKSEPSLSRACYVGPDFYRPIGKFQVASRIYSLMFNVPT